MRRFWDEHSLTIIIAIMAVATLAAGVWATWVEYVHNEQGTAGGHHVFWSTTFAAYFGMQVFMNFLPELMGLLTIVLLTKRARAARDDRKTNERTRPTANRQDER
jgi:uncharacterized membrane protein